MRISNAVLQYIKSRELELQEESEVYLLAANEEGDIVDVIQVAPSPHGCVYMPSLESSALAKAYITVAKKGLVMAGIAVNMSKNCASNADIKNDRFSPYSDGHFNPSNIFGFKDTPVILCDRGKPIKYVLNYKAYKMGK